MVGLQAWIEWGARTAQVATTYASLINLASALAQHAGDTIEVADTAVLGTVARLQTAGTSPEVFAAIDHTLKVQKAMLSRLRGITVTDSEGNWLATSETQKGKNLSDRIYFQRHRDDPDLGLFISPPIKSVLGGQWIITVSRRFNDADGAFGGIVFAVIDLSYFVEQYTKYDLGPNRLVALLSTDGTSIARYPSKPEFIGQNLSYARLFSELRERPAGSYVTVAVTDGTLRYTGYRQSDRYPLVVAAAVTERQALGAWRAGALHHMLITGTLAGAVGLLGQHLIRQVRRSQAAEAQLRESESRYRLLTDHAADVVTRVGPDGMCQYVSPAALRIIGVSPEALLGTKMVDLLHPNDRMAALETIERLKTGETEVEAPPFRILRLDGTEIWIEPSSQALFHPVTGAPDGCVRLLRDITRRVAAETALRESEERLRLLLQSNVTEALYLLDPDGKVETWNASAGRIKGYSPAEVIGQNFSLFFTPEDLAKGEPARILAIAREHGHFSGEGLRVRKGGERFFASVSIDAVYRNDGTLRGFVKVTRDITRQRIEEVQRAQARDRAEEANRAKSRFLANVSHELRTPLHGILGYAEMLAMEGGLSPTQSERLQVMKASGQHLLGMINAVLDLSQIEAGRLELQPTEIDLPNLIRVCLDVIRPAAEAKGLTLVNSPTSPVRLFADPTRLRQVLINLLGNAVKFTTAGAIEVRLRREEAETCIRLEVVDTGPGILASHHDKLFQTFERLNVEAVSGVEGAGLGLAIAARLTQLMGGRIGYHDNPGGGSVFWLELPLHAAGAGGAADPTSRPAGAGWLPVADDGSSRSQSSNKNA